MKITLIIVTLFIFTVGLCTGTLGVLLFVVQSIWYLVTGWIYFIVRNVQRAEPHADVVLAGLIALLLIAIVIHRMMRRAPAKSDRLSPPSRWPLRRSAAVVGVIVLLFVAGVSTIAITHQTLWMLTSSEPIVRNTGPLSDSAARSRSQSNLKAMIESAHNYDNDRYKLPAPTTLSADGRLLHSWQTHLLPYMDQSRVYMQIDLKKPWNDPSNRDALRSEIEHFRHPIMKQTHDERGYAITSYSLNIHALPFDIPMSLNAFPNGTSNVLFIGEAAGNYPAWGYPLNVRDPRFGLNKSLNGFGGPVRGITQFVMLDGSVRSFTDDTDPEFLRLIAEPGR